MDPILWRNNIKEDLAWLADEERQRRVWLSKDPGFDFPDEAVLLLDDHAFAEFIEEPAIGLAEVQKAKAREFKLVFDQFRREAPSHLEGAWLVDDPRWVRIRMLAKELHDML